MGVGSQECQKTALHSPELELQVVVWMSGSELVSSIRVVHTRNYWTTSLVLATSNFNWKVYTMENSRQTIQDLSSSPPIVVHRWVMPLNVLDGSTSSLRRCRATVYYWMFWVKSETTTHCTFWVILDLLCSTQHATQGWTSWSTVCSSCALG